MKEHKSVVGVDPELVRAYGPTAGILLSQLLYWAGKSTSGWVKRTIKQLEKETGLKKLAIIRTLKRLEREGVIKRARQNKGITIWVNVEYQNDTNQKYQNDTLNGIKMIPNRYQNDTNQRYQNDTNERVQVIENQILASPKINNKEIREINKILDNNREPGNLKSEPVKKEDLKTVRVENPNPETSTVRAVNPGHTPRGEEAPARDEQIERRKAIFRELKLMGFDVESVDPQILDEPDPQAFSERLCQIDKNAPEHLKNMLNMLNEIGERNRMAEILRKYRERYNPRYIPQRWDINANAKFWSELEYYVNIHTWQKKLASELGMDYIDYESFTRLNQITAFCIREVPPSKASLVRLIITGWFIYKRPDNVGKKAVEEAIENAQRDIKAKALTRQY